MNPESDYLECDSMSDAEITELSRQDSLPPNQIFQLPSDEKPTENQPTYIETN